MESLAVRWLFPGKRVEIDSGCLDCGETVRIVMKDEQLLEVEPETSVGYMPSPFARSRAGSGAFN